MKVVRGTWLNVGMHTGCRDKPRLEMGTWRRVQTTGPLRSPYHFTNIPARGLGTFRGLFMRVGLRGGLPKSLVFLFMGGC